MDDKPATVTRPTRGTLFLRTFLPWQLWRFAAINLKMIGIIRRSHRSRGRGREGGSDGEPREIASGRCSGSRRIGAAAVDVDDTRMRVDALDERGREHRAALVETVADPQDEKVGLALSGGKSGVSTTPTGPSLATTLKPLESARIRVGRVPVVEHRPSARQPPGEGLHAQRRVKECSHGHELVAGLADGDDAARRPGFSSSLRRRLEMWTSAARAVPT